VPVHNFYKWRKAAVGWQPYAVGLAERSLMALAGLCEDAAANVLGCVFGRIRKTQRLLGAEPDAGDEAKRREPDEIR
jgi:putative SOS response-associated peptidase YedK